MQAPYEKWFRAIQAAVEQDPHTEFVALDTDGDIMDIEEFKTNFQERWKERPGPRTFDVKLVFHGLRDLVHKGYGARAQIVRPTGTPCTRVRMDSFLLYEQ